MTQARKARPGIANEHEIRLNVRLLRGRDGELFSFIHSLVAHLGPRQRVDALRLWMMSAASARTVVQGGVAHAEAPTPRVPARDGEPSGAPEAQHAAAPAAADNSAAVNRAAPSAPGRAEPPASGKLDMSQLEHVEMDLDFMGPERTSA